MNAGGALALGQIEAPEKANEITVAPTLIAQLNLRETIVTTDALLTQKTIAKQIVDKGGYYFLAVKKNQRSLFEDIKLLMEGIQDKDKLNLSARVTEKNRGRIEVRTCWLSLGIKKCSSAQEWSSLQNAVMVESSVEKKARLLRR